MEQGKIKKIKPCIVKLNRLNFMEDPEIIRERILDQRVRKCHVLLRRCDFSKMSQTPLSISFGQFKVRRCCVRLPKLNVELFDSLECSSQSVLSDRDFDSDNECINESA